MSGGTTLELSVSGAKVRPLLNLFSVCVKLSSGGFFLEPSSTALVVRAVSDSKSSHFIAEVPAAFFDSFKFERPAGMEPLNLQLVSRGVAASILRYCASLTRLVMVFETAAAPLAAHYPHHHAALGGTGSSAHNPQDLISFILYCHSGTTKTFRVHLGDQTVSEKADVQATDGLMTFRAVAEPRLWCSLFSNFPPSTKAWTIHPTELRLTLTDDGDEGSSTSDAQKNVAVVSADRRTFTSYHYPTQRVGDGGDLTPGGVVPHTASQLPGKTFELKPFKYLLLLADHLQLQVQLSSGGANVPAVHIEGIRRAVGGAGGIEHMVSYASLLVAATDFVSVAQQQRQQSVPRMSSSSSHTPAGAALRASTRMSSGFQGGASSNIRSASNFADHRPEPIMSAAPTFGDLPSQSSRDASVLAPASAYALEARSSGVLTAVAPSFVEATPSPQKRQRESDDADDLSSFFVPGSEVRSLSSSHKSPSFVEGTVGSAQQRSISRDDAVHPSFASSRVAATNVTQNATTPGSNEPNPSNILMQLFPLDFNAIDSDDDDDGDDDHFALETFIASRRVDAPHDRHDPEGGFVAASAFTMVRGTQH